MSVTQVATPSATKLAVVFGIGAALTATYGKDDVVYSDGKSSLSFKLTDDTRKPVGLYDVTVISETELAETLAPIQPTVAAPTTVVKPAAKQSPSFGYGSKVPC